MNIELSAGEVWMADLGYVAKARPVLILAAPDDTAARSLVIVAPLTSQIRGLRGEVPLGKIRWLPKPSAVNVQGLASLGTHVLSRKLGTLGASHMEAVKAALRELLGL